MRRIITVLTFVFAINLVAYGQVTTLYRVNPKENRTLDNSGEIITATNDTLFVELKLNQITPDEVLYRLENEGGDYLSGSPSSIDVIFTRYGSYFSLPIGNKKRFAKRSVSGPMSLYYIKDDFSDKYLIKNESGSLVGFDETNYISVIKSEIGDCISEKELSRLGYSQKYIEQAIYRYNSCKYPEKYEYVKINSKPGISITTEFGAMVYTLNSNATVIYNRSGDELTINNGPFVTYDFGLDMNFKLGKIKNSIGFHYSPLRVNTTTEMGESSLTYNFFSFPIKVMYEFNNKLYAGISVVGKIGGVDLDNDLVSINEDINSVSVSFGDNPASINYGITAEYWINDKWAGAASFLMNDYSGTGSLDIDGYSAFIGIRYKLKKENY